MLVLRLWREERGGTAVRARMSKSENVKTAKPSMTSTFGMVRDAGLDTWSLSDRATKLVSPAGIAWPWHAFPLAKGQISRNHFQPQTLKFPGNFREICHFFLSERGRT